MIIQFEGERGALRPLVVLVFPESWQSIASKRKYFVSESS